MAPVSPLLKYAVRSARLADLDSVARAPSSASASASAHSARRRRWVALEASRPSVRPSSTGREGSASRE
eukprot:8586526-Pyramimonas_sp.AAC.1